MLLISMLIVGAITVLVLLLLAIVVVGIRQEPPEGELACQAPNFTAALVRRLLGVSVLRRDFMSVPDERRGDARITECTCVRRAK
jgi:hypothetical protein